MLTVLSTPPATTFARNQNVYKVRVVDVSGYPYRAFGSRAFLGALVTATGLNVYDSISITYIDPDTAATQIITFEVLGVVSDTNLPQGSGTVTSDYVESVWAVIAAHPLLAPFFEIQMMLVGTTYTLYIEARDRTIDYELTIDLTGVSASGWSQISNQAPASSNVPENFAVRFDILFETYYKAGGWQRVATSIVVPDDAGYAAVDLESILDREMGHARYTSIDGVRRALVADISANEPWIADNVRRFMVRAGEQQGSPLAVLDWNVSATLHAIDGGVTQRAWAQGAWLESVTGVTGLATWRSRKERWLSPRQPAYLSWYNNVFAGAVQLRIREVQGDGTAGALTVRKTRANVAQGETVTFAVGAEQLGILSNTRMYVCEIWLADESGATVQATCVYYVDGRYYEGMRFLLWRNSWGVPEELRITGHYAQSSETERSVAQMALPINYTTHTQERVQYDSREERVGTYRTGYISRDEIIALQDMVRINDVWEVQPDGSLLALDLLTNSFRVYDTRDTLHAIEFQAVPRLQHHNHAPGFNADNHGDQNNVLPTFGGPWIDNSGVGEGEWTGIGGSWNYGG